MACRLHWRLSASWYELGLTGWFVGWAGQVAGRWAGCLPCRGTACGQAVGLGWRWRPVGGAGLGKLRSWLLVGASWAGQVGWPAGLDKRLVGAYGGQVWPGFILWAELSGGSWCRAAWLGKLPIWRQVPINKYRQIPIKSANTGQGLGGQGEGKISHYEEQPTALCLSPCIGGDCCVHVLGALCTP